MPHVNSLPIETLSKLSPFSGLILCIVLVIYFIIRFYLLQPLMPKLYKDRYTEMSQRDQRSFLNHHIAGSIKISILIAAAYPFLSVAFGTSTFHSPMVPGQNPKKIDVVTMGDILVVAAHMLSGMYVFELFYRDKISPVSVAHHIGTIIIAQTAIAISLSRIQESDASIEFMLCTVWGAFDIIAEFLPHLTLILYRLHPTSPRFLSKLFQITSCTELAGTISETAVTMWLFGSLWPRWTLPFKIVTPFLHVLFAAAQLWGAYVFWRLWQREARKLSNQAAVDIEGNRSQSRQGELKSERQAELTANNINIKDTQLVYQAEAHVL